MKNILAVLLLASVSFAEWKLVTVPTRASFRGLSAVNADIVWTSGTQGTVIRTTDRGKTWHVMQVPGAESLDFRGIRAFDADTAFIMSSGKAEDGAARTYRTRDGGKNWDLVFQDRTPGVFMDAIAFWDRDHGIVLSDPVNGHFVLFATDDGGSTWNRILAQQLPPALPGEGAFAASNSCLVVQGNANVWFVTGGASVARVFRSNDRGKTWSVSETPMHPANASSGLFSLTFRDEFHGVAVGGDYANPTKFSGPNVVLTIDGGETWRSAGPTNPAALYFSAVAFLPDSGDTIPSSTGTIWAAGSQGMNSAEAASSWRTQGSENFNALAFPAFNVGWAVGPEGRVARWDAMLHFTAAWAVQPKPSALLDQAQQLLVVTASDWNSTSGTLRRFEKENGVWRLLGESVSVSLGRSGLGVPPPLPDLLGIHMANPFPVKQEGDGRSPAGIFRLTSLFGSAPQSRNPHMPYHPLTENTVCVDDPRSLSYNRIVEADRVALPDWRSGEQMRSISEYREGVVVGFNDLVPRSGQGSCIFLHSTDSSRHPTAGCTAMNPEPLSQVIRWLDGGKHPVLVQMPEAEYQRRKGELKLP